MIFIIEISRPFQAKPGYFRGTLDDVPSHRAWWLWFTVSYCKMPLHKYTQAFRDNKAEFIHL